jgi:hypothetical protein
MNQGMNPSAHVGRAVRMAFRDNMMTFDGAGRVPFMDQGMAAHPGVPLGYGTGDSRGVRTWDGQFRDSTGAFLVGELERLDQTLHDPLAAVTFGRDIDLREDVTIADEISSFTLSTYGSAGGLGAGNSIGNGKAWIGKVTNQVSGVGIDINKITNPLTPWGLELKYTILELESAAKIGRPIDQQKYAGLQLKHQMDIDEQVYFGDTNIGATGLVNHTLVTNINNVVAGAGGSPLWTQKTPDEILNDVNSALVSVWTASAYAVIPSRLLLPPAQFGYISTQKVSLAGNMSILKYLQENNLLTTSGRGKIDIFPLKWLVGAGAGGTIGTAVPDRMVVYSKDKNYIRYPMTLLQRTPIQYDSIYHKTTYFCRLGNVECVYPETVGYFDGL